MCLQQGVSDAGKLTFIAKKSEDGRKQQHQLPQHEFRSLPVIKHGHRCQGTDEKETDLANTEQDMAQHNPAPELNVRLKIASIPIGRLHYDKAKQRDGKVLGRTSHLASGSQFAPLGLRQSVRGNQEARPKKTPGRLRPVR